PHPAATAPPQPQRHPAAHPPPDRSRPAGGSAWPAHGATPGGTPYPPARAPDRQRSLIFASQCEDLGPSSLTRLDRPNDIYSAERSPLLPEQRSGRRCPWGSDVSRGLSGSIVG